MKFRRSRPMSSSSAPDRSTVDGTRDKPGMRVGWIASAILVSPIKTSYVVSLRSLRGMPSPVEALPCGSRSITRVGSPTAAKAVPRLMAVVVLPTPPFWLATTKTRGLPPFSTGSAGNRAKFSYLQNDAGTIGCARMFVHHHPPRFTGFGQFRRYRLTLQEQINRVPVGEMVCIAQQLVQWRDRPCCDDVRRPMWPGFDAHIADVYL